MNSADTCLVIICCTTRITAYYKKTIHTINLSIDVKEKLTFFLVDVDRSAIDDRRLSVDALVKYNFPFTYSRNAHCFNASRGNILFSPASTQRGILTHLTKNYKSFSVHDMRIIWVHGGK